MIGVYKITNKITHKSYIGQSTDITQRWNVHIRHLYKQEYEDDFQEDFNKYGISSFTFEIIEILPDNFSLEEREIIESKYIYKYDTFINGYNRICRNIKFKDNTLDKDLILDKIINNQELTFKEFIIFLTKDKYILNCKYNDIFKFLREYNYFYYDDNKINIPDKKYIKEDYFKIIDDVDQNNKQYKKIYVLDKGKIFLEKLLLENNLITLRFE